MKNSLFRQTLATIVIGYAIHGSLVHAQSGTITFNGEIIQSTCVVTASNANGSVDDPTQAPNDLTVTLPTVTTSELSEDGKVAGTTAFTLVFGNDDGSGNNNPNTGCIPIDPSSGATLNNISAFFENEAATVANAAQGRLKTTAASTATNVNIQLLAENLDTIDFNDVQSQRDASSADLSNSENTLTYHAQYFADGAASGAGSVEAKVRYSVIYH